MTRRRRNTPKKQLWKLEDGITFSALSKWMECPEQFSLSWIDGLTPKKISIPLEFGSVMHFALQNQFKGTPEQVISTVTTQYREHRGKTITSNGERSTLDYILGLARVTFPHYCKFWRNDDSKITWVGREEKFSVKHMVGDREITIRGMRDGIYEAGDAFGIFETKTKSKIVESDIVDNLHGDMQTLLYCYCTFLSQERCPNQVIYNVIRRSDLYRRKGEKLEPYLSRVNEDIMSRPEFYFQRWRVYIGKSDIDNFVNKSLNPILNLFIQWYDSVKKNPLGNERFKSPYHYLNYPALVGKYGKVELWDAIFGNPSLYRIREQVFPELEESFEVTWETEDDVPTPENSTRIPRDLDSGSEGNLDTVGEVSLAPWEGSEPSRSERLGEPTEADWSE